MANAYSEDLRSRALALVDEGKSVKEVAKLFQIGIATLYLWRRTRRKTGVISPKKDWRQGYGHKIKDLDHFKDFVEDNKDLLPADLAKKWGNVTPKTIRKWLHRIGYSRKKRLTDTKSGVKKSVIYIWSP